MNKKGQLGMLFAAFMCVMPLAGAADRSAASICGADFNSITTSASSNALSKGAGSSSIAASASPNSLSKGATAQLDGGKRSIARFSIKNLDEGSYLLTLPYLDQPTAIFKRGTELWIASKQLLAPALSNKAKCRTVKFAEGTAIVIDVGSSCVQVSYHLKQCSPMQNLLFKKLQDGYHWPLPCPYKSFVIEDQQKRLYVFALAKPGLGSCRKLAFDSFCQLEAVQGLVFEAENLKAFEYSDGISIKASLHESSVESSLPWHFEGNFQSQKRDLQAAILSAPTTEEAYVCTARLAKLYFSKEQYGEAASVIKNMGSYLELENDLNLQFILAAAEYVLGREQSAQNILSSIANKTCSRKLEGEMFLFESFAKNDKKAEELFCASANTFLKDYHEGFYWKMAFSLMERLLEELNLLQLESLLNQVRLPKSPYGVEGMKYYESMLLNIMGKREDAQAKLAKLAKAASEPKFKVLAALALVDLQEPQDAIERLNSLRLEPLDIKTANKLTLALADLHASMGEPIAELRNIMRFKGSNIKLEARALEAYKKIFLSELNNYSPLQAVAAFREFRDLLPPGQLGDQVVLSVAKRLVDLDLLGIAEEMLRHQIKNRLSGNKKSEATNSLACIMIMNGKPKEALDALNQASLSDTSLARHQLRSRLKSIACIALGKYEQALFYLEGDSSYDAFMLKKEALFKGQNWQEYASLTAPSILSLTEGKTNALPSWAERDAIRLSLSYVMLNATEKNSFLAERIKRVSLELANEIEGLMNSVKDCEKLVEKATGDIQKLIQSYCQQSFEKARLIS